MAETREEGRSAERLEGAGQPWLQGADGAGEGARREGGRQERQRVDKG